MLTDDYCPLDKHIISIHFCQTVNDQYVALSLFNAVVRYHDLYLMKGIVDQSDLQIGSVTVDQGKRVPGDAARVLMVGVHCNMSLYYTPQMIGADYLVQFVVHSAGFIPSRYDIQFVELLLHAVYVFGFNVFLRFQQSDRVEVTGRDDDSCV